MVQQALALAAQVPASWPGSLPEFLVYQELERRGYDHGVDFTYQSPLMGGRTIKGGVVVDFVFNNPPDLAIGVQGTFWHYEQGVEVKARDILAREQLAGLGMTLIFIDEDDVLEDVEHYVAEALRYRDHSRLGR
jgi:hypothetical protein